MYLPLLAHARKAAVEGALRSEAPKAYELLLNDPHPEQALGRITKACQYGLASGVSMSDHMRGALARQVELAHALLQAMQALKDNPPLDAAFLAAAEEAAMQAQQEVQAAQEGLEHAQLLRSLML